MPLPDSGDSSFDSAFCEAVLDMLPVGIIVVGEDLLIRVFNRWASAITGFLQKETLGKPCSEVLKCCREAAECRLKNIFSGRDEVDQFETTVHTHSGIVVPVRMNIAAVGEDRRRGMLAFHEITRIKALERERMNLLSMVSHDLKSSVSVVGGFVQLLLKKPERLGGKKTVEHLTIMQKELDKMESMTSEFLECAHLEEIGIEHKEVRIDKELRQVAEAFGAKCRQRDIHLRLGVLDGLPAVAGDAVKLNRAFGNLMTNALKYSQRNGSIGITAGESANEVLIRFSDTGSGIDADELSSIFDFFKQGGDGKKKHGFGLGLAVVKTVIEKHGGHVDVQSAPGRGTEFTVFLPKTSRH